MLTHQGIEVKTANTGDEALQLLQQEDFDLILMDIQMPEMNGIDATKAIRSLDDSKKRNIPIIALTANALKGEEKKYLAAGMNDYLTKPFKQKELYTVMERILSNKGSFGSRYDSYDDLLETKSHTEKLYDLTLVNEITKGNQEFMKNLVQIFIDTIPATCKEMIAACAVNDWEQASKLAHKLKSTVDTMQIASIKEEVRTVEMNGKQVIDVTAIPAIVHKIALIISEVTIQLKKEFGIV
jgi:CheY-like chemotaxis protein